MITQTYIHFKIDIICPGLDDNSDIGLCGNTNGLFTKYIENVSCKECKIALEEE